MGPPWSLARYQGDSKPRARWPQGARRAVSSASIAAGSSPVGWRGALISLSCWARWARAGGSAAVFEATIRARGLMPAPHSHDGFEETVYGLEGVSTWTVD